MAVDADAVPWCHQLTLAIAQHVWHTLLMAENGHTAPINLNVDNLIHCINRDQRNARQARERGRWSDAR